MSNYYDGDFSISPVLLKSIDGQRKLDITNQVGSIDIYESVLSPVILGEMLVFDPFDFLQGFPIRGEEYVEFEVKIAGPSKSRKEKLIVTEVTGIEQDEVNRSKMYVLRLAGYDLYASQKKLLSKKYRQNTSDIVRDILYSEIRTDKTLVSETTRGIDDVTITSLHPFEAIDFVRHRSISPRYASSSYVFFENRDGYQFKTLEAIYEKSRNNIGDRRYTYSPDANVDARQWNYRNILAYEHVSHASTFNQVQHGGLHNEVVSFDITTGLVKKQKYQNEKYEQIDRSGADLHTGSFIQKHGDTSSTMFFTTVDSSLPTYDLPEKIGRMQGFVQNITSSLLWIEVYGDTATTIGDVIEVNLPEAVGTTSTAGHKLISGNYFIGKCRHMFVFGNVRYYTQSMELIKGSYLE